MKKKLTIILTVLLLLVLTGLYCYAENRVIEVSEYTVTDSALPKSFDGYRILQISDFHNTVFGENQSYIMNKIKALEPDLIVVTGDLIDAKKTNIGISADFIDMVVKVAPVYFVAGNHEARIYDDYNILKERLLAAGVTVMENEARDITVGGESITLIGLDDPMFTRDSEITAEEITRTKLDKLKLSPNTFKLLLSHRPDLFEVYVSSGMNLTLSGHAHGGQFRFPLLGGLISPNQEGLFPDYTEGLHEKDSSRMIISRGLGNSVVPVRLNNNPELILITLESEK